MQLTFSVHSGVMFMAHVTYQQAGVLHHETVFARGLSQDGAEHAIAGYANKLREDKADDEVSVSPVVMLPGICTLVMPEQPACGKEMLLKCSIERCASDESRIVSVRDLAMFQTPYHYPYDGDKTPLARHLPVKDREVIQGFVRVRFLRREGEHMMVNLPQNDCPFDCTADELVPLP